MPENETLIFVLFNFFIIAMLALDLGIFHKKAHGVGMKEAVIWSIVWVAMSLTFCAGLFIVAGPTTGFEFLTGYLIEKALSVDNIFVFILIFSYFGVPQKFQHKILFWGVLGALIMRSIFILTGAALISRFEWILYVFGAILIISGWKMMMQGEAEVHPEKNIFIRLARKFFPVFSGWETSKFFVRRDGKLYITNMFLVLITIETTDVVFAVDSIPAIFAVTRDPFIVYSSNVFAILGLRALYFVLAGVMNSFYYLKTGLSLILVFVGIKMIIAEFYHLPIILSLLTICAILTVSVVASIIRNKRAAP
ncbi:MAG: TerC family protein [Bacteroidota bacterium]